MTKIASMEYKYRRDQTLKEGLGHDEIFETSEEIRRDPFHEHFMREAMHPYHFLLNIWKRHPHSKVDFYLPGFEMP